MNISYFLRFVVIQLALLLLVAETTQAGSATWNVNPVSDDWNTAANWTPNTVPNGASDVATFASSNTTSISLSAVTTVKQMSFNADASPFTISTGGGYTLTFAGTGIVNNSGLMQNFVSEKDENGVGAVIQFTGAAVAGALTLFTLDNGVVFFDNSSAQEAVFLCHPGTVPDLFGANVVLAGSSDAGNASITLEGGNIGNGLGGGMFIGNNSGAGNATVTAEGGTVSGAAGALVVLSQSATADHATFVAHGGQVSGAGGALIDFRNTTTASEGLFVINGSAVSGAEGAELVFIGSSSAGNATITINGGIGTGGLCLIGDSADGGTARVKIFGNGVLSFVSFANNPTLGSIEGDGIFELIASLALGSNNLDTTFSGLIEGGNELTKIGTGTLTLTGANTCTGAITVEEGALIVDNATGSGTGTGRVRVDAGTLGGGGIIAGKVFVGTGSGAGAFLAPGNPTSKELTLTIESALTFNADATYTCTFKARRNKARSDKVVANGVTINSGATFDFSGQAQGQLRQGLTLTVLSNTSATPIAGAFSNLADGAILTVNGNNFQADYEGGDGNDLTLTVVP